MTLPAAAVGPPLSQIGDLWVLGRHRVFCGNALDATAFPTLIGEEHAAMVFTDPPYNVPIEGHASGLGATHHRPFPMASGEMDRSEPSRWTYARCGAGTGGRRRRKVSRHKM